VALGQTEGTLGRTSNGGYDFDMTYIQNLRAWIVNCAQFGTHFSDYFWDSPRYRQNGDSLQPQP